MAGNVSDAFVEENAIDVNGQRYGGGVYSECGASPFPSV